MRAQRFFLLQRSLPKQFHWLALPAERRRRQKQRYVALIGQEKKGAGRFKHDPSRNAVTVEIKGGKRRIPVTSGLHLVPLGGGGMSINLFEGVVLSDQTPNLFESQLYGIANLLENQKYFCTCKKPCGSPLGQRRLKVRRRTVKRENCYSLIINIRKSC